MSNYDDLEKVRRAFARTGADERARFIRQLVGDLPDAERTAIIAHYALLGSTPEKLIAEMLKASDRETVARWTFDARSAAQRIERARATVPCTVADVIEQTPRGRRIVLSSLTGAGIIYVDLDDQRWDDVRAWTSFCETVGMAPENDIGAIRTAAVGRQVLITTAHQRTHEGERTTVRFQPIDAVRMLPGDAINGGFDGRDPTAFLPSPK